MTEHLSEGEWGRWRDDDREWKQVAMRYLMDHTERLTTLEANSGRAETAASSAENAKRWAVVGNVVGAIVQGLLLAFGIKGS